MSTIDADVTIALLDTLEKARYVGVHHSFSLAELEHLLPKTEAGEEASNILRDHAQASNSYAQDLYTPIAAVRIIRRTLRKYLKTHA